MRQIIDSASPIISGHIQKKRIANQARDSESFSEIGNTKTETGLLSSPFPMTAKSGSTTFNCSFSEIRAGTIQVSKEIPAHV